MNIHLPPLRERREDIPLLAAHFIREQNAKFGTSIRGLAPEALSAAREFAWPGNIRQLQNVIEASMAMENGDTISLPVLAQFIDTGADAETAVAGQAESDYAAALAHFERDYLKRLLQKTGGNIEAAAREAGMNMATIYRKLKKYELRREDLA
jgi:DNA-binding NtrC family response regulator